MSTPSLQNAWPPAHNKEKHWEPYIPESENPLDENGKVKNPHKYLKWPVREGLAAVARRVPTVGMTFMLQFSCHGNDRFEQVKSDFERILVEEGIFDNTEQFAVLRLPQTDDPSIISGHVVIKLEPNKYTPEELNIRGDRAVRLGQKLNPTGHTNQDYSHDKESKKPVAEPEKLVANL